MPPTIRLVAIDVDGTLLDPEGTLRPRVAAAVKDTLATGCQVVLATGRRVPTAGPIARRLGISTLILMDGAVVYDLESASVRYERTLDSSLGRQAIELVRGAGLPPVLFESPSGGGRIFVSPVELDNPETAGFLGQRGEVCRLPVEQLPGVARVASVAGMGGQSAIDRLAEAARRVTCLQAVRWTPSSAGYRTDVLGLTAPNISKGNALLWLAEQSGLPREATLAIGDFENDVDMLTKAGVGVAMGNAIASVKAVARDVVADNRNDGVAEALEKWVLRG
ncbi:MAG: HAD hydrolase family protein [Chloroflexota bacterium]